VEGSSSSLSDDYNSYINNFGIHYKRIHLGSSL
jgi:hypothetical protein